MKRGFLTAVVAVTVFAVAGTVFAAGNTTVTVSAAVLGTCKFVSGTAALAFGTLDPAAGTDVNASGTTQFWCTKGVTTDAAGADNGLYWDGSKRNMRDTVSGDSIPYTMSLTPDANPNAGPVSPRTLTINGSVLGTDYTGKSAGSYADTVVLTITP